MNCPSCESPLLPEQIRAARRLAHCNFCGAIITLIEVDGQLMPGSFQEPPPPPGLVIEVNKPPTKASEDSYRHAFGASGGEFVASTRWFTPAVIFLTFFAVMWDGFLVFWYTIAFSTDAPFIMVTFPLLHVAVGLGITLFVLAGWLNETRIEVANGKATCTHGPVPIPFIGRKVELSLADIQMFLVAEKSMGRSRSGRRTAPRWTVNARLRSGETRAFIAWAGSEERARFLQRKLESFLE